MVWNGTAPSALARMNRLATAMQLLVERVATEVRLVEQRELLTLELTAAMLSGGNGSKLIEVTTNTSLSRGDRLRSIVSSVKVLAAVSVTPKLISMLALVAFNPVGMYKAILKRCIKYTPIYPDYIFATESP